MKNFKKTIFLSFLISTFAYSQEWNITQITKTIASNKLSSIEELIPLLPEDYRSRSIQVYSSRSIQEASPEAPRVIMFGKDASLMMSFNGHKSQKGYNQLEIIQFNKLTKEYEFYEISFDPKNKPSAIVSEKKSR